MSALTHGGRSVDWSVAWVIAPWGWIVLYDPNWFESATEGARTLDLRGSHLHVAGHGSCHFL